MAAGKAGLIVLVAACAAAAVDIPVSSTTNGWTNADYVPPTGAGTFAVELPLACFVVDHQQSRRAA